ncbi:murein hydrolase activator EnvC family protein [Streptomyces sp. NPDC056411]|uniref:murein hydrolase activator EnvC family protein n=1 Tax=Streptomyces sp. NPDC056411 TaxID=3345813 RepID=UPI0035E13E1D
MPRHTRHTTRTCRRARHRTATAGGRGRGAPSRHSRRWSLHHVCPPFPSSPPSPPPLPSPIPHSPPAPAPPWPGHRHRFRAPTSSPPAPPGREPGAHGPSCFFPARAAAALLAPAAAALFTLTLPLPAMAAAATAHTAAHSSPVGTPSAAAEEPERRAPASHGTRKRTETGHGQGPGPGSQQPHRPVPGLTSSDRAWPVEGPGSAGIGPTVLRGWEPPPSPWAAGHRGVDLASSAGQTVRAATPGRVVFTGTVAGRGVLTIEIADSGRPPLHTTYEPVRATARKGQRVTAGQPVAVLQHGPFHCRAPCLHWGLRRGKTYLDPLSLLPPSMRNSGPSRLLPVFGIPLPETGRAGPVPRLRHTEPAGQGAARSAPTGTALGAAVGLAAVALWALGRLSTHQSSVWRSKHPTMTGERARSSTPHDIDWR